MLILLLLMPIFIAIDAIGDILMGVKHDSRNDHPGTGRYSNCTGMYIPPRNRRKY